MYEEKKRQEEVLVTRDALLDAKRKLKGAFTEVAIALGVVNKLLDKPSAKC